MTDRRQLEFWLRPWSCAEDSEAEDKPNGKRVDRLCLEGLGKGLLNMGFV